MYGFVVVYVEQGGFYCWCFFVQCGECCWVDVGCDYVGVFMGVGEGVCVVDVLVCCCDQYGFVLQFYLFVFMWMFVVVLFYLCMN